MVKVFIDRLRIAGITPDQVITDDSRLYPSVLAETWPTAMHQLCLFHATRRVVRAVNDVVKEVRRSLPTPPPASRPTLLGSLRRTPPAADQHDADSERYRRRLARRTLGIAQAHALHQHIASARAIGATTRRQPWHRPPMAQIDSSRVREDLRLYPTLFLHQPENITTEERQKLADLLTGPSVVSFVWLALFLRNGSPSGRTTAGEDALLNRPSGATRSGGPTLRQPKSHRYAGNSNIWTGTISSG